MKYFIICMSYNEISMKYLDIVRPAVERISGSRASLWRATTAREEPDELSL